MGGYMLVIQETGEAEIGRFSQLKLEAAWSTQQIPSQPWLHRKCQTQSKNLVQVHNKSKQNPSQPTLIKLHLPSSVCAGHKRTGVTCSLFSTLEETMKTFRQRRLLSH